MDNKVFEHMPVIEANFRQVAQNIRFQVQTKHAEIEKYLDENLDDILQEQLEINFKSRICNAIDEEFDKEFDYAIQRVIKEKNMTDRMYNFVKECFTEWLETNDIKI